MYPNFLTLDLKSWPHALASYALFTNHSTCSILHMIWSGLVNTANGLSKISRMLHIRILAFCVLASRRARLTEHDLNRCCWTGHCMYAVLSQINLSSTKIENPNRRSINTSTTWKESHPDGVLNSQRALNTFWWEPTQTECSEVSYHHDHLPGQHVCSICLSLHTPRHFGSIDGKVLEKCLGCQKNTECCALVALMDMSCSALSLLQHFAHPNHLSICSCLA